MRLDARHLRSEKLLQYYLALSILRGELLIIEYPTKEMIEHLELIAPFANATLKGAGIRSKECHFLPSKIVKKLELNLNGKSPVPLLQTILLPFLFCGHKVTITLKQTLQEYPTTYYLRDVLFAYLHKYMHAASLFKEPNGDIIFQVKGKYVLDAAPAFVLKKNTHLVAIRGEVELKNDSIVKYIELTLKDFDVPLRIRRKESKEQEIIHLNALYGSDEGYDNDSAYILYKDFIDAKNLLKDLDLFKEQLKKPKLSQELIEDLLLYVGLLGGELPFSYKETDFLLDALNEELPGMIERKKPLGYQWSIKAF